jgi:hypothetical protein
MTLLLAIAMSIPLMQHPPQAVQKVTEPPPKPISLTLYTVDGTRVAVCDLDKDSEAHHCKIDQGFTLDDVMTAWMQVYRDKPAQ